MDELSLSKHKQTDKPSKIYLNGNLFTNFDVHNLLFEYCTRVKGHLEYYFTTNVAIIIFHDRKQELSFLSDRVRLLIISTPGQRAELFVRSCLSPYNLDSRAD